MIMDNYINFTATYNETEAIYNDSIYNDTIYNEPVPEVDYTLKKVFDVFNISIQIIIMTSMGCVITIEEILVHLKKPVGVGIALLSQFVVMPLSTYGMISILKMPIPISLSIMIMSCCPGGSSSNLFTYLSDGDVPLSIMLTTTSTLLAIGLMPLNLWLYAHKWTTDEIRVPYKTIAIAVTLIVIPLAIGMAIRKWLPKVAKVISLIGSICGLCFILVGGVLQHFVFPETYHQTWKAWLAAFSILTLGFSLGFLLALLVRQPLRVCRTIGIETGMQSIGLALAIIIVSFPVELQRVMTPFPMFYGIILFGVGVLLACVIRGRDWFVKDNERKDPTLTAPILFIAT